MQEDIRNIDDLKSPTCVDWIQRFNQWHPCLVQKAVSIMSVRTCVHVPARVCVCACVCVCVRVCARVSVC